MGDPPAVGILATGGGLIFSGSLDRWFSAHNDQTGEELWRFYTIPRDGEPGSDESFAVAAIREGAVLRVRPKAMTVAVIVAGLLPILFGGGTGAEVMRRIAAPMVGTFYRAPAPGAPAVAGGPISTRPGSTPAT